MGSAVGTCSTSSSPCDPRWDMFCWCDSPLLGLLRLSSETCRKLPRGAHSKIKTESEVTQLCPTLCDPLDYSLQGSSIHGIFQARVLEWVAISFSRGSFWPRDWTQVSSIASKMILPSEPPGKQKAASRCKFQDRIYLISFELVKTVLRTRVRLFPTSGEPLLHCACW